MKCTRILGRSAIIEDYVFYAAMYLDPRFHFELTEKENEKAIKLTYYIVDSQKNT